MRYQVTAAVWLQPVVIPAAWPKSGHGELSSLELVPVVSQGRGVSRIHCSLSGLLMLLLIPVPLWQVLYCQLEKGKQPQALFTYGFSCYAGVTSLGKWRCTVPLISERNRGICKLLNIFFNKMFMLEKKKKDIWK